MDFCLLIYFYYNPNYRNGKKTSWNNVLLLHQISCLPGTDKVGNPRFFPDWCSFKKHTGTRIKSPCFPFPVVPDSLQRSLLSDFKKHFPFFLYTNMHSSTFSCVLTLTWFHKRWPSNLQIDNKLYGRFPATGRLVCSACLSIFGKAYVWWCYIQPSLKSCLWSNAIVILMTKTNSCSLIDGEQKNRLFCFFVIKKFSIYSKTGSGPIRFVSLSNNQILRVWKDSQTEAGEKTLVRVVPDKRMRS